MKDPYDYNIPNDRIAQRPVHPPHNAKLLIVSRTEGVQGEGTFLDLPLLLSKGDLVVLNNTRVLPSRMFGMIPSTGSPAELLLLKEIKPSVWLAIGKPLKRLRPGIKINLASGINTEVIERSGTREIIVRFFDAENNNVPESILRALCSMPIPPYIRGGQSDEEDRIDYQTEYARIDGSVAAPTAGLHITGEVLLKFREKGVVVEYLTLHVGPPSFLPLEEDNKGHLLPPGIESLSVSSTVLTAVREARQRGSKVIAIGTTVVRALESSLRNDKTETDLFITPGFKFEGVTTLVTNFHQPKTTHLLLVESLLGRENLNAAYNYALRKNFRFLSYGDGMVII